MCNKICHCNQTKQTSISNVTVIVSIWFVLLFCFSFSSFFSKSPSFTVLISECCRRHDWPDSAFPLCSLTHQQPRPSLLSMAVELGLLFTSLPDYSVLLVCASLYFSGLVSYHNFLFFFSVQWFFLVLLFLFTCFCLTIRQLWLLYGSVFGLWSKQNLFRICQNKLAMDPAH